MKSRLLSSSPGPSLSETASQMPALFSNAHRAETIRQLQQAGYPVHEEKLPRLQTEALGFDPGEELAEGLEEGAMPWVAERGIVVHQAYGAFLQTSYRFMLVNVTLNTVVDQAQVRGHRVTGRPGYDRPDGVAVEKPGTTPTPLTNLVELKPKGTALTGEGPAQVARYQKALENCGLETSLMPQQSPLANVVLPVVGYGEVEFTGMQDGIVGYAQLRRQPEVPAVAQVPEKAEKPSLVAFYQYLKQLMETVEVSLEVALGLAILLVAIVVLGLLLHIPPPVPV